MFFFPCPGCTYRMQSTPDRVGHKALCPKCYKQVVVPDPEVPAVYTEDTMPSERSDHDTNARTARVMAPINSRSQARPDHGGIVLFQSDHGPSPSDAMTQLTAAITMRMKPPPEPPATDLKISTGVWMILTALGITLWLASVIYQDGPLHLVLALSVVMLSIGIGWIAYIAGRSSWIQGVLTLLPPVAIFRLFNGDGNDNHRPLRFVLSGLLLLALFVVNPVAREFTRRIFGMDDVIVYNKNKESPPNVRLQNLMYHTNQTYIMQELIELNSNEKLNNASADERASTVEELRKLSQRPDAENVTAEALKTLVTWAGDEAKPDLIAATQSPSNHVMRTSLELLAKWKSEDSAKIIAPYLLRNSDRKYAGELLRSIGQPAETAIFEVISKTSDQNVIFMSFNILTQFGGQKSVEFLKQYSVNGREMLMREIALSKAVDIQNRLSQK